MWLVQNFTKKSARKALTTPLRLIKPGRTDTEGILTSYCAVVNHLLAEYASDEIIAETFYEIKEVKQQLNQSAKKYSKSLWG